MTDYGHWNPIQVGDFDPDEWFGFIYLIRHKASGREYIGRKNLHSFRKKKRINKRTKTVQSGSDWREYTSSSKTVKEAIETEGKDAFEFLITHLCSGKSELTYMEEKLQYEANVLFEKFPDGTPKFFNRTIGHRHFSGVEKQSDETKRKRVKNLIGVPRSDEVKKKISQTLTGVQHSEERRKNIGEAQKISYEITWPDGRVESIRGIEDFCLANGLNTGAMVQVARGKLPHHKKFKCRYLKPFTISK